jgi:8-oxo-dGTP pyrophosphatase MutT (NUDIX family)
VLLPLLFRESPAGGRGEFQVQLIKRSSRVPQPGDLSLPGGMLHPVDRLLRYALAWGWPPIVGKEARGYALAQPPPAYRLITLFLANALRESWEEIHLRPSKVRFLGPLPSYDLRHFRATIFPLAGLLSDPGVLRPNREVERIVEVPLSAFLRSDLYGCYQIAPPDPARRSDAEFPCLIFQDRNGEEILWGATFNIIISFLAIVTGFSLPDWKSGRLVRRSLPADYLTGSPDP